MTYNPNRKPPGSAGGTGGQFDHGTSGVSHLAGASLTGMPGGQYMGEEYYETARNVLRASPPFDSYVFADTMQAYAFPGGEQEDPDAFSFTPQHTAFPNTEGEDYKINGSKVTFYGDKAAAMYEADAQFQSYLASRGDVMPAKFDHTHDKHPTVGETISDAMPAFGRSEINDLLKDTLSRGYGEDMTFSIADIDRAVASVEQIGDYKTPVYWENHPEEFTPWSGDGRETNARIKNALKEATEAGYLPSDTTFTVNKDYGSRYFITAAVNDEVVLQFDDDGNQLAGRDQRHHPAEARTLISRNVNRVVSAATAKWVGQINDYDHSVTVRNQSDPWLHG